MVRVKLCVAGCKDFYICSYYRPNVSEEVSPVLTDQLAQLSKIVIFQPCMNSS